MYNFLLSACTGSGSAAASGGCYDWPVIKQIIDVFCYALKYLYNFLDWIGIANIGLVIIIFTLVIKCIILPLTIRQQKFTKLTNVMQPELRKVQEKYQGRRDQMAMQAMQAEQKAIYAKYGVSQSAGCIVSFIQFPILIALYGALREIPVAIEQIGNCLTKVADILSSTSVDVSSISSSLVAGTDQETMIKTLYSLPTKSWESLQALFTGTDATVIGQQHDQLVSLNSFCGWDISQTPWNLMMAGGIGIIAVLIPLISGFSQWLSFKLTQTASSASQEQSSVPGLGGSQKIMTWIMPLFSVYICFTFNAGLGLYWCASSFFQVVLQILINRHYRRIDMDAFIKENMEKAEAKAKTKREKNGVKGTTISSAANISTKNIDSSKDAMPPRPASIKDIANMDVSTGKSTAKPSANSLAAKAASVQQYNEAHEEDQASIKKKYKK